jgi:hypothetical protein
MTQVLFGISALDDAGFSLPRIQLENITISGCNGQVKVGE